MFRLDEFVQIYNHQLRLYRQINRVRSRVHPVPDLARDDDWLEAPFWIWQASAPRRRRLFCRRLDSGWCLSDRESWETVLPCRDFIDRFLDCQNTGVRIRPRALMTTMFSRLVLSDLFIHGTGGAKYDALTNAVASRFFHVALPDFLAVTATMKLGQEPMPSLESECVAIEAKLRQMTFHPERFVDPENETAAKWTARKRESLASPPSPGGRRQQHLRIEQCNQQLRTFIEAERQRLIQQRDRLAQQRAHRSVLESREFSYCLFSSQLPQDLFDLAQSFAG